MYASVPVRYQIDDKGALPLLSRPAGGSKKVTAATQMDLNIRGKDARRIATQR